MRILLHACCGPCLIYPYEVLSRRGHEVTVYFFNPNIHPYREYARRYFTLLDYCHDIGAEVRVGPYDMERFLALISPNPEDRCSKCFETRLARTAEEASLTDMDSFATTLLVSPYQDQELIFEAGRKASLDHGVPFLEEDMKEGYRQSVRVSRELEMYRQPYCGCVYSEKERYQKSDPPSR